MAGELAATEWDPEAGFAAYERQMRPFVEANQEIGRLPRVPQLMLGLGTEFGV